jgi:hypothetical protein
MWSAVVPPWKRIYPIFTRFAPRVRLHHHRRRENRSHLPWRRARSLYVDVILRRYEAATGEPAVLVETGETFEALAARRASEAAPV